MRLFEDSPNSPNSPLIKLNPFRYNTFEVDELNNNIQYRNNEQFEDIQDMEHDPYSFFGIVYRKFCFSSIGLKFTICLNALMVLINTFLIVYEIILIVKHNKNINNINSTKAIYYNFKLPIIYLIFDILLTVILFAEISLIFIAIYGCNFCDYFKFRDHKIDFFIFCLSSFLCVMYVGDMFGISNIDNIGFLILRIIRDIMRFFRCIIFLKFLVDSIVKLTSPKKTKYGAQSLSVSPSRSSKWNDLQFVCL